MTNVSMNNHESKTFRDNVRYRLTVPRGMVHCYGTDQSMEEAGEIPTVASKRTWSDTPKFCIVGDEQRTTH